MSNEILPNALTSFQQCNDLISKLKDVDILEYIEITQNISNDYSTDDTQASTRSKWIKSILQFIIENSNSDGNTFAILVSSLNLFGFNMDKYKSHRPKWIQLLTKTHDDIIKQERRFLKHYKLVENIEYISNSLEVQGKIICTGHSITSVAFYKILSKRFGAPFLETLLNRIGQIVYHYDAYKNTYLESYIASLKRTIDGMAEDIHQLNQDKGEVKSTPLIDFDISDDYSKYDDISSIDSDAIMSSQEYNDELTDIHRMIEHSITRVDDRISDIHSKLNSITHKIDDLVESIATAPDEVNPLDKDIEEQPLIGHVKGIFREYRKFGKNSISSLDSDLRKSVTDKNNQLSNRTARHTCIGNAFW